MLSPCLCIDQPACKDQLPLFGMALNPVGIKNCIPAKGKFVIGLLIRKVKGVYTLRLARPVFSTMQRNDWRWLMGMEGEAQGRSHWQKRLVAVSSRHPDNVEEGGPV